MEKTVITIQTTITASIDKTWECWTLPAHITGWNFASTDWCCPSASNNVEPGGTFSWRMEAKDGSFGFDLNGTYQHVEVPSFLTYTLEDNRKVEVRFKQQGEHVQVTEKFEAETTNDVEMQRVGWQAILDNFKRYVETQ